MAAPVWCGLKGKIKSRDVGEEAVTITHESRGSGEELLKQHCRRPLNFPCAPGKAGLPVMKVEHSI